MLRTLTTCYDISNNPLNTSKSKQLYSMPRSKRFQDPKIICDTFYNLPEIKSMRSTSLGFGQKVDFSRQHTKTPGPNNYKIPSQFTKKHGYSFRLNRDQVKFGAIQYQNKNPSPDTYNVTKNQFSSIAYSMRSNTPNPEDKHTCRYTPGPGTYQNKADSLSKSGKYYFSKYKDTGYGGLINPCQREIKPKESPGPGQYKQVDQINGLGFYVNSRFETNKSNKFSKLPRKSLKNVSYGPGPGGYIIPSDFGLYGSTRFYGNDSSNSSFRSTLNNSFSKKKA